LFAAGWLEEKQALHAQLAGAQGMVGSLQQQLADARSQQASLQEQLAAARTQNVQLQEQPNSHAAGGRD
jgi:phage shock protein A